ncbi:PREDICTED: uncharacterized protein LOC108777667 [Cyphomyrmex costatus]|uniref:uncharacterized protein LOC108777667 n=1 Tax=Cyphomyrmex costatus TaxID=456900 RepID=UPI0008521D96|nr:PREDICTED: uncharacterized protein LOC108777667 [Cyphomyrmex costatus]
MWEQRADGMKKLKPNAVPTIFGFFLKKKISTESVNDEILTKVNNIIMNIPQSLSITDRRENQEDQKQCENLATVYNEKQEVECEIITNTRDDESLPITYSGKNKDDEIQCEHKHLAKDFKKHLRMINMRRQIKVMRKRIQSLETKMNTDKYKTALKSVFTEDQIQYLHTKKRFKYWSNKTIHRALRLKFLCGNNGYKALINQGYPFPSLRTLRRKLEDIKFERGISNTLFEFLQNKKTCFENEADLECGLVFDEMASIQKIRYDSSTGSLSGNITVPNEKDNY